MKIIAIDPGYDRVGVAIIEKNKNTKEQLIFSECLFTNRSKTIDERIYDLGTEIQKIITNYEPDICAIENIFFTNNQKTVIHVAESKGVMKYVARCCGLEIREYTPLQIKMAITGDGRATKDTIARMIPLLIKIDIQSKIKGHGGKSTGLDDELDAIALGLCASAHTILK